MVQLTIFLHTPTLREDGVDHVEKMVNEIEFYFIFFRERNWVLFGL